MEDHKGSPAGTTDPHKRRHLARVGFFFLLGFVGLLLVFWYSGPFFNLVHSYVCILFLFHVLFLSHTYSHSSWIEPGS
jgi:hypothetical protein